MGRQGYKPEQIISKLREAEILLSTGQTIQAAVRQIGITEQTYYRWRKEYGGMKVVPNLFNKSDVFNSL